MRGNSGAELRFCGDYVVKDCLNARDQYFWFQCAEPHMNVEGVRLPFVRLKGITRYEIEYIRGYSATMLSSVEDFKRLVKLVDGWGLIESTNDAVWGNYIERLHSHVVEANSPEMWEALAIATQYDLPSSFNHGDLTLENVLVENDGGMVLIDPNYSDRLFQSYLLDYGKLLQSVHSDYHRVFNSSPGEDPAPLFEYLRGYLEASGEWELALVAELTHVMRLRKYRKESERSLVDALLRKLMGEIEAERANA